MAGSSTVASAAPAPVGGPAPCAEHRAAAPAAAPPELGELAEPASTTTAAPSAEVGELPGTALPSTAAEPALSSTAASFAALGMLAAPASRAGVAAAATPGGLAHACFGRGTALRYASGSRRAAGSACAARTAAYRLSRSVGEFFDLQPGPPSAARADLGWNLARKLCSAPGFQSPENLLSARVDSGRGSAVSLARVLFYTNGPRAAPGAAASYAGALVHLGSALEAPVPHMGNCARHIAPLPPAALRLFAHGPRPDSALVPASFLPRALEVLGL